MTSFTYSDACITNRNYNKILYEKCKNFNINSCSVRSLIEYGANPLYEYKCKTPLRVYVSKKNINIKTDVVILLLESVEYKNINDFDIFEYVMSDNVDIGLLKLLISKGLKIDGHKNNMNILEKYATVLHPNIEVFKLFLDNGIPICSDIKYGYKISLENINNVNYYDWSDDWYYDYVTNEDDKIGKTILYYYIVTRPLTGFELSLDVIKYMVEYEKEILYYTYRSHTVLYYYVGGKHNIKREIFDVLLDSNYHNNERINILYNYLHKQYRNKYTKIDNYIVNRLLDDCDCYNDTILELFNMLHNNYIITTLLKIYKYSIQSLMVEYLSKHKVYINVIKCMMEEGAILYRVNHLNAYFLKFGNNDPKVVEFILKNGIDVNTDDTLNIMPLFSNNVWYEEDTFKILKLCIPYIGDINKKDKYGTSILVHCINSHNLDLVEVLLDNDADINVVTAHGCTCISSCIIMACQCKPKISELYIKILEIILAKIPTIECIKKTIEYLDEKMIIYKHNESIVKTCIKYFMLVDYMYVCNKYPLYIEYITDCKKEIDDMIQSKIHNTNIFELMCTQNNMKKRYIKHPVFTEWSKKQYRFYNEIINNANKLIKKSEDVDNLIDNVSVDNNRLSKLPLEIRYIIFSYAFPIK
ncbi:ankyrin repeat protein [Cotia virus SPAn232]|uniref:Ankyrin repeat protein n=2 Tax=Cotia virus TaxID=39444 RepID=A0A097IVM1_9POXV|nr:ankyrin repeat protein [Cotia virus SPAn232]AFB76913.1 ankyrin repeat protein [Cotia virus SPAn232]AIT70638.1 ankyrin repeat protein [Cotia virus]